MTEYYYAPDFGRLATGSKFQTAETKIVYPPGNVAYNWNGDTGTDAAHQFFKIVAEGDAGANCFQYFFPQGDVGASGGNVSPIFGTSEYIARAVGNNVINVEHDWKFKTGFDFHSQGKTGPRIANGTAMLRVMWNSALATSNPAYLTTNLSHFRMYIGNESTGAHYLEANTSWNIVENTWYHIHMQMSVSFAKIWIKRPSDPSEVLYFNYAPAGGVPGTGVANAWSLSFSSFFGGAGSLVAAQRDCYAIQKNIEIWTGLTRVVPIPTIASGRVTLQ